MMTRVRCCRTSAFHPFAQALVPSGHSQRVGTVRDEDVQAPGVPIQSRPLCPHELSSPRNRATCQTSSTGSATIPSCGEAGTQSWATGRGHDHRILEGQAGAVINRFRLILSTSPGRESSCNSKVCLSARMAALSAELQNRSTRSFQTEVSAFPVESRRPTQPRRERFET